MAPTIRRRNTFCEAMSGVDAAAIGHETMIVNGKVRMYLWAVPRAASHSAEFHLSSGTREMVADFRILRRSHRAVCVCRDWSEQRCVHPRFRVART